MGCPGNSIGSYFSNTPLNLSSRAERREKVLRTVEMGAESRDPEGVSYLKAASRSFRDALSREQHRSSPVFCQVLPAWIHPLNERDLLLATPSFNLLFTRDSFEHIVKNFVVNQSDTLVGFREPFYLECFVLKHPCVQMTCNAGVQRASEAGHDVDPILVLSLQAHEGKHDTRPDGDRMSSEPPGAAWQRIFPGGPSTPRPSSSFLRHFRRAPLGMTGYGY